jgi:hypothetical protein
MQERNALEGLKERVRFFLGCWNLMGEKKNVYPPTKSGEISIQFAATPLSACGGTTSL